MCFFILLSFHVLFFFSSFFTLLSFSLSLQISEQSSVSIYRVNGTNGATCILIRTDGILDITYQNNLHENVRASIFLPDYPDIKGDCTDEDISSITLSFMEFKLLMVFKKTPGGERWYVSNIELTYSSSNGILMHVDRPNLNVSMQKL